MVKRLTFMHRLNVKSIYNNSIYMRIANKKKKKNYAKIDNEIHMGVYNNIQVIK